MWAHLHSCVGPTIGTWLLVHPSTLSFHLSSTHFLIAFHIRLGIPHLTIMHISWWQCGHTIEDLCIHLLHCPCDSECIAAHDTFRNIVVAISLESGAHVQREVSHLFPPHAWRRMYIVITKDNFLTLADVVIVDLTCTNLVQCVSMMTAHVATIVTQDTILHRVSARRWFHSLCHRGLWLSPSLFWFLFYFLCTCQYSLSLADLLGTFDAYISL